jgi:hypothetical protein
MTLNEKSLNYKVIDLVESYNFHINFISIQVHKKVKIFLKKLNHTTYHTAFADATVPPPANAMWYGVLAQTLYHMAVMV